MRKEKQRFQKKSNEDGFSFWYGILTDNKVGNNNYKSCSLHTHNITDIQSADQAAKALEPLVRTFPNADEIAGR
jgi:hypothetical protein